MNPLIVAAALLAAIGSAGAQDTFNYNYRPASGQYVRLRPIAPVAPWRPSEYRPINEKHWYPPKVNTYPKPAVSWVDVENLRREVDRLNAAALSPDRRPEGVPAE